MSEITGKHIGDLFVDEPWVVRGMVVGNILVRAGGVLSLNGMCIGDVIVEVSGEAAIAGIVNGNAFNLGGSLEVSGAINGMLMEQAGTTTVADHAIVRSRSPLPNPGN